MSRDSLSNSETTLACQNWELRINTEETFGASLWLYLKTQLLWMVILLISSGTGFDFTGNTFGEGENRIWWKCVILVDRFQEIFKINPPRIAISIDYENFDILVETFQEKYLWIAILVNYGFSSLRGRKIRWFIRPTSPPKSPHML